MMILVVAYLTLNAESTVIPLNRIPAFIYSLAVVVVVGCCCCCCCVNSWSAISIFYFTRDIRVGVGVGVGVCIIY